MGSPGLGLKLLGPLKWKDLWEDPWGPGRGGEGGAPWARSLGGVPEKAGLTPDEHGADGEDLLDVGVGAHVAKAHAGEAAEREVKRGDVGAAPGRAARRAVDIGHLQPLAQLMQPAWRAEGCGWWGTGLP